MWFQFAPMSLTREVEDVDPGVTVVKVSGDDVTVTALESSHPTRVPKSLECKTLFREDFMSRDPFTVDSGVTQ